MVNLIIIIYHHQVGFDQIPLDKHTQTHTDRGAAAAVVMIPPAWSVMIESVGGLVSCATPPVISPLMTRIMSGLTKSTHPHMVRGIMWLCADASQTRPGTYKFVIWYGLSAFIVFSFFFFFFLNFRSWRILTLEWLGSLNIGIMFSAITPNNPRNHSKKSH